MESSSRCTTDNLQILFKRTVNVLASYSGVGERHDLQRPGRLQQAAAVRAQRNAEGGQGGISIVVHGGDRNLL